jgi:hypothetical protein
MSHKSKIQSLIVKHLQEYGSLDILLPDGIVLEIGITQVDKNGDLIKTDDYCYVAAHRDDQSTLLDSYNLGLSFVDEKSKMIFEDQDWGSDGQPIRRLEVI